MADIKKIVQQLIDIYGIEWVTKKLGYDPRLKWDVIND
jgi:hypothetical protein